MRLLVIAFAGCSACSAKPPYPASQPALLPERDATSCTGNVTPIPGGQVVVDALWREIPVKVLLDTGASVGGVSRPFAQRHGLEPVGTATRMGVTGTVVEEYIYDVGTLQVGGLEVDGTDIISYANRADVFDFKIGTAQLLAHAVRLDVLGRSFCLVASPDPLATIPMRIGGSGHNRSALVTARFGSVTLTDMVLDTGAAYSTLRDDLITSIAHAPEEPVDIVDAVGLMSKLPRIRVPEICVDQICLREQPVVLTSDAIDSVAGKTDGLVGMPFFVGPQLAIDYPAARFALGALWE